MTKERNNHGRVLGVDFGDVRTGLAISDDTRFLASGIGYIKVGGIVKTADKVAEIFMENHAVSIVVGHPINMNGTKGPRAERAEEFAQNGLKEAISAALDACLAPFARIQQLIDSDPSADDETVCARYHSQGNLPTLAPRVVKRYRETKSIAP